MSSGMGKAQDKVLQSLYGLGTDMTVTKAQSPSGSSSQWPRFRFDARGNDDTSTQSSDRVMVQGFTTLASSTVGKVASQTGVSQAVGGLSLNVFRVDGQFTRGQFQQNGSGGAGGFQRGEGQPQGEVRGGGADFAIKVGRWLSVAVLVAAFLVAGLLTSSAVSRRPDARRPGPPHLGRGRPGRHRPGQAQ